MPFQMLNLEVVASYLHLAPEDIEQRVKDREIPFEKRGDRIVFRKSEIDAWASQRILRLPGRGLDWYHRKTMRGTQQLFPQGALIPALLRPEGIELDLPSKTKASVIRDMVALADRTGRVFDSRELLDSVEAREALCSTALPGGLALLHARQHQAFRFEGSFIVLGRTIQAIPFGAPDGRETQLFFLVCCQDDRIHLHTLARLCLLALKTNIIAQLSAATDPAGAYEAMVAAEQAVLPAKVEIPEKKRRRS